ncbi:DUF2938 family protein [Acinetobacter sp. MB5]|uniref:DUF2938 family protein n=1 Tax=Acinetobacter sp. MB5 TaxID=2069438 RepID=UPI000DD0D77C|nr:DUF2938 family protein [Acinetobacter sp. MB5]
MFLHVLLFILVVGVGSTIALDLWANIARKIGWMPGTHWPSVGRWIIGAFSGKLIFDSENTSPFTTTEAILGWGFHYIVGIAYAAMFPLFLGVNFIDAPTIFPFFLIGVVISSLAGLGILMPAMGGGFFARKTPSPVSIYIYVIVAHIIFAIAQYLLALTMI